MASSIKDNPKIRIARKRVGYLQDQNGNLCVEPGNKSEFLNDLLLLFSREKDVEEGELGEEHADILM